VIIQSWQSFLKRVPNSTCLLSLDIGTGLRRTKLTPRIDNKGINNAIIKTTSRSSLKTSASSPPIQPIIKIAKPNDKRANTSFALFVVIMGYAQVPYAQEIVFVISLSIVLILLNDLIGDLSENAIRHIKMALTTKV
jgi:hypothetical protein